MNNQHVANSASQGDAPKCRFCAMPNLTAAARCEYCGSRVLDLSANHLSSLRLGRRTAQWLEAVAVAMILLLLYVAVDSYFEFKSAKNNHTGAATSVAHERGTKPPH
jgi:hypothetical protein